MMKSSDSLKALNEFGQVDEERVEEFEDLVADVSDGFPRHVLGPLILTLDDSCEFDEVMFGVIHGIESFPRAAYFEELLAILPLLKKKSPRWCGILHTRIMNSNDNFSDYLELASTPGLSRDAFVEVLREIESDPRFEERCRRAIQRVQGS